MFIDIEFYPMSECPLPDKSDDSFSKTVLIFGERDMAELGYFDFEEGGWSHFGNNKFPLICWCYLPSPDHFIKNEKWQAITPPGYRSLGF